MGDGGSYFLGYVIAAMGILGSVKSQVAPAMMIPLLALGVPIFDTILSPVRRFMRGRAIFSPDNRHIHHRLKSMGLSTSRAVLLLYGVTAGLCLSALVVANLRDERAGLFLILLGLGAVVFIRKLGYFEYLGTDKFLGWLRDMTDESGISPQRRGFLNLQIEVTRSEGAEDLWQNLVAAGQYLRLDFMELRLLRQDGTGGDGADLRTYVDNGFDPAKFDCTRVMQVVLPLSTRERKYGCLTVAKDLDKGRMGPFMLRRIEQLRRSTIEGLRFKV
jgi:UDP-GlcNAc:undecaprenyl-phosphate GlcNAc-1-phosphate transferase